MLPTPLASNQKPDPPRDPSGEYHERAAELADDVGADVADVLDHWEERAAAREYDGETPRHTANELAFFDTVEHYRKQRSLF